MRTFVEYIEQSSKLSALVEYVKEALGTKLTKEWMEEHYKKYNKDLFNNELPSKIKLGFIVNNKETALGIQGFNREFAVWKDKMKNGMYQTFVPKEGKNMLYWVRTGAISWEDDRYEPITNCAQLDPYIEMNPRYDFSDFQKEDTLIHEMVHLWVSRDGLQPKRSHGKEFTAKCNEVRKLAKRLYGIEYQLGTRAKHEEDPEKDFQISDEWKAEIKKDIEIAARKGGGVYGILLYLDKSKISVLKLMPYTKRFVFCTRSMLVRVLKHAKTNKAVTKIIVASPKAYIEYCNKYGKFRTVNSFNRFWDMNEYDEKIFLNNIVKEERLDESLNEGLLDWLKKIKDKIMNVFVKIKGGTPTSAINLEDYVEDVEKIEDEEREGCAATDKKMIEDK